MSRNPNAFFWTFHRAAALGVAAVALLCQAVLGQTIPNPSFEADTFTVAPGYISGNTSITGWTANQNDRAGLNPASDSPFADNGAIPAGLNVAFIQSAGPTTLSTTVSDLAVGTTYKVTLRANARSGQTPSLRISIDGTEVLALTVYSVGGTAPYGYLAFEFTAAATSQTMALMNDAAGDTTVLVDDFTIAPTSGAWSVAPWTGDGDSGVDASFVYTHAYSFANSASFTINGIPFTGVEGGNPAVAGQFSTVLLGNVFAGDGNNITTAGGGSAVLATDFVYQGGAVAAGSFQTITIQGLTPGTEYVATIYSVGWEAPSLTTRWATFNVGDDRLTINQDKFLDNNGIAVSYRYTADASGTVTLRYAPVNPSNVSIHTYGFSNREAVSRNVAPVITVQPRNVFVAEGQAATFSVQASGIPAPTYQWRYNGVDFTGANTASFSLPNVLSLDEGDYDVVVSNIVGSVTSVVARLKTGLPMTNPSFEVDTFTVFPGYVSGNGPITGWTALGGHGINSAAGPFANNGAIPHGNQVAFMQADGALSQLVSGFTVDAQYYLHYYENSRSGYPAPALEVTLGGATLIAAHAVPAVGGSNPYHEVFSEMFVATATEAELAFVKSNPLGGDTTAVIDNVVFVEVQDGTPVFVGRNPEPRIVSVSESTTFVVQGIGSLPLSYQWLKDGVEITGATAPTFTLSNIQKPEEADYAAVIRNDFGMVTSAVARLTVFESIPDLFNTGVGSDRVTLADGAVDPHYQLIDNPDTGSLDAIVEDSTAFPIVDGTWLASSTISGWIGPRVNTAASAVGLYTYRTVIDLADRDPSTVVIVGRWSTDNAGRDIRVNGVSTGNPENGAFNVYTPFTIYGTNSSLVAGSNAIDFIVENVAAIGYTGLRVEILQSNVRIPPGVVPAITTQPASQQAAIGDTVTFTGGAVGTGPLSYQWNKDSTPLAGQTGLSLVLSSVTTADSGIYTLSVSNSAGSTVSAPAALCVWLQPIPGVFGTGLDETGALLAAGAVDPHYILAASADPAHAGPEAYVVNDGYPIQVGAWALNGPNSKWIAPWANQNDSGTSGGGNVAGSYTYQTSFDLTGHDVSKLRLIGGWAVDNTGTDILVNGVSTGITSPGFGGLTSFTITSAQGLVAGPNTLDFVVNNAQNTAGTPNPAGLRVDLKAYLNILDTPPELTITQSGGTATISWSPASPCERLQSASAVTGPWSDVDGAANPFTVDATDPARFFRVVMP